MATRGNKLLEDIHPLSIITEVQKWPVLYSKDSVQRGTSHFKTKVWHEVAKSLFNEWDTYTEAEKECRVTDLCKRWRNLRDTFKRQVELEKRIRKGHETKRKTYVYFKHMLFLLPHVTAMDNDAPDRPALNEYFNKEKKKDPIKRSIKRKVPVEQHFIEETPISIPRVTSKGPDIEEIDEDRHFALSLIPTLKKMSDDEKLTAKMEILKVLREVRNKNNSISQPDSLYHGSDPNSPVKIEFFHSEIDEESQPNDSESDKSETHSE